MPRTSDLSLKGEPPTVVPRMRTSASLDRITPLVRRWSARLLATGLLLCLTGCGTNLEEVLFQTIAAAGRTYVDLVLTDVANDLAEAREDDTGDEGDGNDADDTDDGDGDGGDGDGDDGDDGNGGVTLDGAALFANNCSACHGEDGASGFAPDISEKTAAELATGLELATHSAISLSEEEITAIAEFLGGATDTGPTGDVAVGEQLFAGFTCGACHCPDATGGCALDAPSLVGVGVDTLDAHLVGDAEHPGGKFDLTAQELADLEAYLASLN